MTVLYHCTCTSVPSLSASGPPIAPNPQHPAYDFAFHPLPTLYFCEECDAVRCNRCVSIEVSGYYCPNCLFEVPSASVRAEKNRCARNCFQCPHCSNTLSIVSSDPPPNPDPRLPPVISSVGEPPFFLYCNFCRWDSAEAGITFDKPTGLALQLQKTEDASADNLEFDRLKEHFEPLIRSTQAQAHPLVSASGHARSTPLSAINAAASSVLSRDFPGIRRKGRSDVISKGSNVKDEFGATYRSRIASGTSALTAQGEIDWLQEMTQDEFTSGEVAKLEQRWLGSWNQSMRTSELKPLRIPLHSKQTKRCHKCRHILVKPEQKSQSTRYKLKLMAANFLPSIETKLIIPTAVEGTSTIHTPRSVTKAKQPAGSAGASADDLVGQGATLQQGRTYRFHMALQNPLYEPIQVRLLVQRTPAISKSKRPPFQISLPASSFGISPFAEAWEYEDDEEDEGEVGEDDIEEMLAGKSPSRLDAGSASRGLRGSSGVGVLERKANVTRVGGEVIIGRDGTGPVKFNMLLTYTYREEEAAEDAAPGPAKTAAVRQAAAAAATKSFSFYASVDLGTIVTT